MVDSCASACAGCEMGEDVTERAKLKWCRGLLIHPAGKEAAVHRQHMAVHITRRIGREEHGSSNEFVQLTKAFHGSAEQKFLPAKRAIQQSGVEVRAKHSRSD